MMIITVKEGGRWDLMDIHTGTIAVSDLVWSEEASTTQYPRLQPLIH